MTPFELVEQCDGIRYRRQVLQDELARVAIWLIRVWVKKGKRPPSLKDLLGRGTAESLLEGYEYLDRPKQETKEALRKMIAAQERRDKARAASKKAGG